MTDISREKLKAKNLAKKIVAVCEMEYRSACAVGHEYDLDNYPEYKLAKAYLTLLDADPWIPVSTPPEKRNTYRVVIESGAKRFAGLGYFNGEEWERVHEASEYQSHEPCFIDYGMSVTYYKSMPTDDLPHQ